LNTRTAEWKTRIMGWLGGSSTGLIIVLLALGAILSAFAGSYTDPATGHSVNTFLNAHTLLQTVSDTSLFAIMAVGMTLVIISGGIDLSVGSIYALSGVVTAMMLQKMGASASVPVGLALSLGVGLICGIINGLLISVLQVHPFIITLGTMWIFRGIAFVASKAVSIPLPDSMVHAVKATLGLGQGLYPVPSLVMILVTALGAFYLIKTVAGRNIYAVGGNIEASRYAGLRIGRIQVGVYALSGLSAGIAAFVGSGYYGSANCVDATGYELYVIASAVVGGASLNGGKGAALGALLGALLITLIRQSIRTLHLDQNYEWIIIGTAVIIAVVLDQTSRRLAAKRGARVSSG
jgi:ribose/xylose/arabinose/galactoside ABC-type transport system permease subunit